MPYVTQLASPVYQQVTWEEILNGYVDPERFQPVRNAPSATRTYYTRHLSEDLTDAFDVPRVTRILIQFCEKYAALYQVPRETLYDHFEIPKSTIDLATGRPKTRPIDAPKPPLKLALYELKGILETECKALYHTSAFAYVKGRCALNAMQRHQANQSRWFLHTDFSNFFGNATEEFVHESLSRIYPFCELYKYPAAEEAFRRAMDLCFLHGALPQGTPVSPMLTNVMMIPIDHRLANTLAHWTDHNHYVYTRYADDILISCKYKFDYRSVVGHINEALRNFHAPFSINDEKTRFQSRNGHNFHLGVILNDKNEITVGYKQRDSFRGQLCDFIRTCAVGDAYDPHDVQVMSGVLEYYKSVEPAYWDRTIARLNRKYQCDLQGLIKEKMHGI